MYSHSASREKLESQRSRVRSPTKSMTGHHSLISASATMPSLSPSKARTTAHGGSDIGSASSSRHSSRTTSPLNLPMETLQSINAVYNLNQAGYLESHYAHNIPTSVGLSRSPYQSPTHTRTNSVPIPANVKSLGRDRSADRTERELLAEHRNYSTGSLDRHGYLPHSRESSRDRRAMMARDRSLEREYPHMGARSLERDHAFNKVARSHSADQEPIYTPFAMSFQNQAQDYDYVAVQREPPGNIIMDLQMQLTQLNMDRTNLQRDLEVAKDKLNSSMNSVKTFWSPELKKERALRKEESTKYNQLNEHFKVAQAELHRHNERIQELEIQLQISREASISPHQPSTEQMDTLRRDKDRQIKETKILRRTVEEMELRIETQKQTLNARDESIKKLLEMLQSKGLATRQIDADRIENEHLKAKVMEEERKKKRLECDLAQKNIDISNLTDEISSISANLKDAQSKLQTQPANLSSMQAVLEAKDSRISVLEIDLRVAEDQLLHCKEEISLGEKERREAGSRHGTPTKNLDKALRIEVEQLKNELAKKENELSGLKLKVDILDKQQSEHQQYIQVLKDQVNTKEQHSTMLQSDIEDLRDRLNEKDSFVEKKSSQVLFAQNEKRRLELELTELKEHLDIKDRRVIVLQRKIDNLVELVQEKEAQYAELEMRLSTLAADQTSVDSTVSELHDALQERDRQIDRLKDQREEADMEHQAECERYSKVGQDLKAKLEQLHSELTDKQSELVTSRDEVSELRSEKFHMDSRIKELEIQVSQMCLDAVQAKEELQQIQEEQARVEEETAKVSDREADIMILLEQVEQQKEETSTVQQELDRLLVILRETQEEKNAKDEQIKELQEIINEYKQKMGTLKRGQREEKKMSAQILEEARKREEEINQETDQLKTSMSDKDERIEELSAALRESVSITADREVMMAEQEDTITRSEKQIELQSSELTRLQHEVDDTKREIETMNKQLAERDVKLKKLSEDRKKQLEEVFEMKQEALRAAICEKDANIALLEMTGTRKQRQIEEMDKLRGEKEKLQQQLKEITENRMHMMQAAEGQGSGGGGSKKKSLAKAMKNSSPEQPSIT